MKNAFLTTFLLVSTLAAGQADVLFSEHFDTDFADQMAIFPSGDDTIWVNFDADNIPPANGALPGNWFWEEFETPFSTGPEFDAVFASTSYLKNEAHGNRNWLITPPISIPDSTYSLFWRSAPFQGPAYHDGYKVLVSYESNFDYHFIDTLFVQAQNVSFTGCSTDLGDYLFSAGHVHADSFSNAALFETIFEVFANNDTCFSHICRLEQHVASLAKFAGQKIYIAFLHDSDDDFVIKIDDVEVRRKMTISTDAPFSNEAFFEAGPNPTDGFLNLRFLNVNRSLSISYELFDALGRSVFSKKRIEKGASEKAVLLDLSGLARGFYLLKAEADGRTFSKRIFKI